MMRRSLALRAQTDHENDVPERKRATLAISQANDSGVFEGYASVFGMMDSGGDVIMPGAFAASLQKRGAAGVKMLWQHQASEPIGVWIEIIEDQCGLRVRGRLDLSVARAREALSLLRSGAVDGLSIGFRTRHARTEKKNGVRKLFEIDLWEISVVTFPMLTQARIDSVKRNWARTSTSIDDLRMKMARLRAHRATTNLERKLRLLATGGGGSSAATSNLEMASQLWR
jgi:HK97 family phage prohead protease